MERLLVCGFKLKFIFLIGSYGNYGVLMSRKKKCDFDLRVFHGFFGEFFVFYSFGFHSAFPLLPNNSLDFHSAFSMLRDEPSAELLESHEFLGILRNGKF